jgi:hypothetical protein
LSFDRVNKRRGISRRVKEIDSWKSADFVKPILNAIDIFLQSVYDVIKWEGRIIYPF